MKRVQLDTLPKTLWMNQAVRILFRMSIWPINPWTGGNLNAASRQALMQKLARTESAPAFPEPVYVANPDESFLVPQAILGRDQTFLRQCKQDQCCLRTCLIRKSEFYCDFVYR